MVSSGLKWVRNTSQINKVFVENYSADSDKRYVLEIAAQYLEKLHVLHNNLPFIPGRMKIKIVEKTCRHLLDEN